MIAKYYERQLADNDEHPVLRTIVYAGSVLIALWFSISLPLFILTERLGLIDPSSRTIEFVIFIAVIILIPLFLYYYLIRKKHLERIVNKYGDSKIGGLALTTLLFLVPFLLFFVGPTITVLLFGGTILDHSFTGLLTPYLN